MQNVTRDHRRTINEELRKKLNISFLSAFVVCMNELHVANKSQTVDDRVAHE